MNRAPSKSFDDTRRDVLRDPKTAAVYLNECLADGDTALFTEALKHVADARGGRHDGPGRANGAWS